MKKAEKDNLWISDFCRQIALLLKTGITLRDGIGILSNNTESDESSDIYKEICNSLDEGLPLYEAMKKTELFPESMINNIQVGENTGNLYQSLESMADFYEEMDDINSKIESAVRYPVFMSFMMFVVIGVLVLKVMPVFSKIYMRLGAQANTISTGIMRASDIMSKIIFTAGAIFSAACIYIFFSLKSKNGKEKITGLLNKFSYTQKIFTDLETSFFVGNLQMSLISGLDFAQATENAKSSIKDKELSSKIDILYNHLNEGNSFFESCNKSGLFTEMEREMIYVSEMSGNLSETTKMIRDSYLKKAYNQIGNAVSLIEPVLVSVFSVIIGGILICTILPLLSITAGML